MDTIIYIASYTSGQMRKLLLAIQKLLIWSSEYIIYMKPTCFDGAKWVEKCNKNIDENREIKWDTAPKWHTTAHPEKEKVGCNRTIGKHFSCKTMATIILQIVKKTVKLQVREKNHF